MDVNYTGKICPFCKTTIQENDEVKVCSACHTPHHLNCWNENKGCTTFGCSEQHYEPQGTNPTDVCKKCGATLGDGQDFCPKCGTPKNAPAVNICGKCGAGLQNGQEFCSKCGQKVGLAIESNVSSAINQFNQNISERHNKNKKKPIIIAAAIAAIVVLGVGAKLAIPKIFVSVDELCARGEYQKAYDKADDSEKDDVAIENLAAYYSAYASDNLKDPSSFSLREVYYNNYKNDEGKVTPHLILYISGANSYGANVSSYWFFTYDLEENEFKYQTSVSDLSHEEYSDYDDMDEAFEKLFNNVARDMIKEAMNKGNKLSKDSVKNINNMFDEDTLDSVELLDIDFPIE